MEDREGFAIAGFVLGLVAFIPYLQILGIPGIVFSVLGKKSKKRGLAIAGLVLSIVALALGILALVLIAVVWGSVSNVVNGAAVTGLAA